mmetsp:Transcript_15916/g.27604  ORF Transcript_15916/g.27604 Transcript_15916/m.27604 type:complete len:89 (+) Transcript_15916:433-699(+)
MVQKMPARSLPRCKQRAILSLRMLNARGVSRLWDPERGGYGRWGRNASSCATLKFYTVESRLRLEHQHQARRAAKHRNQREGQHQFDQ